MVNNMSTHKYVLSLLVVLATISVNAQDISFKAIAPDEVEVGEQFRIVYEINDRVKDFTPPEFSDFIFLSSQQGISTINWKTTQQYVYFFKATKEGTFKVNSARAKHKGDLIESNSLEIKVIASGQSQASAAQKSSSPGVSSNSANGKEVFVRLIVDKKSAYVGEQITAYVKVYTKLQLSGIDNNFQGPDVRGFYVQNVKIPPLRSLEPEKIGDETYYSGLIRKMVLIPQKSGEVVMEPFEVVVQQDKPVKVGYFTTYQTQNVSLNSNRVVFNIKPLPSNKPAGFTGAIGDLDIKATLSTNELKTNDAVVFTVTVKGSGNIKLIDNIKYALPPTFEVFDPIKKTKLNESGRSGSKIFEITAIPRHAGEYVIKPFELVFFNPEVGRFQTKKTNSFVLNVSKSSSDSSRVIVSNLSREDVEMLESDIRYIVPETSLINAKSYLVSSGWYYALYVGSFLLFGLIVFLRRSQIKQNANIARTKHRKAGRLAHKRFKLARKMMDANNVEAFYEELSKALWGYISDKLSIPQSELSVDSAKQKLVNHSVSPELVDNLLELIQSCEFARYAPGTVNKQPGQILDEANKLLSKIDNNL